ncbi:hypothetical protein EV363DRAFT_1182838, partial [Boletus edulis]
LATSDNKPASDLGQCLEALRLISAPRVSSVFANYVHLLADPQFNKVFRREHLSRVPFRVRPLFVSRLTIHRSRSHADTRQCVR